MKKGDIIQLWLDAEEENRNGNHLMVLLIKERFSNEFTKLTLDDKKYVTEYLEDVAG